MNKVFSLGLLAISAMAVQPAQAEQYFEGVPLDLTANASWVSDYRFRGVSQTDEKPALQLGADAVYSLEAVDLYLGAWGSNTDFNDGDEGRYEVDYYGGVAKQIGDFSLDAGFIYYTYPGARDNLNYDFFEYTAAIGYDYEGLLTTYSINYSPDFFASSDDAYYHKLSSEYSFYPGLTFRGYIAHQDVKDNAAFLLPDYNDWGVGATYEIEELFDVSLTYISTNLSNAECGTDNCDGTIILSVAKSF